MIKNLPQLLLILFLGSVMYSCGGLDGTTAYKYKKWKIAAAKFEEEYKGMRKVNKTSSQEKKDEKKHLEAKIAYCYAQMNSYKQSERWYGRSVDNRLSEEEVEYQTPDPAYLYEYALTLKSLGEYKKAIKYFEFYKTESGDTRADEQIAISESAKAMRDEKVETRFRVDKENSLSSSGSDYSPIIMNEGVVITSTRDGEGDEGVITKDDSDWDGQLKPDLFIARKQKGRKKSKLQKPMLLENSKIINTAESEGSATFDTKGRTMYFTACNRLSVVNDEKKRDSNCVVMVSRRRGSDWSEPKRMDFCTDSSKHINYGHPALSPDGKKLYFSSNMEGGFGGHDLWVCTYVKKTKSWSDPINLGSTINTPRDEMFPIAQGDNALYFSSNGHIGVGGLDIFRSYGRGNEWTKPKNLLQPLNSEGDDFSMTFETDRKKVRALGQHGYFASNRDDKRGFDNIYSFRIVPLEHTIEGYVYNRKTNEVIPNAKVTLFNLSDTTDVYVQTDDKGYYYMTLSEEMNYSLRPYKKSFTYNDPNPTASTVGLEVSTDFKEDMYLDPMIINFELDILYDLDDDKIRPDAATLLDSFALTLKEHYYTVMELSSHTDCRAPRDYNLDLSQRRAESAVNYLISKGIDRERFVAKGYGEDKLKEKDCWCEKPSDPGNKCTDEQHQANRRTEIRILSRDYVPKAGIKEGKTYEEQKAEEERLREQLLKEIEESKGGG